jgi:hypothetical protein
MMADETKNPDKRLFIDEDWKSQVEAEREAARHSAQPAQPQSAPGPRGPLPPPTLTFLVSTLYLQGAMALGLLANPANQKVEVQLEQAKHSIDLLTMLQQKTEGNRTPDESEDLEGALHELRLTYVTVSEQAGTST